MKLKSLERILSDLLVGVAGDDLLLHAEKVLQKILNSHTAGIASTLLARSFTKRLDGVIDTEKSGLGLAEREAVAKALVDNAVVQLHEFETLLKEYPAFQVAVARAKETGDTMRLQAARAQRLAAQQQLRRALDEVSDALAGKLGG
jgi:hypothetical protein